MRDIFGTFFTVLSLPLLSVAVFELSLPILIVTVLSFGLGTIIMEDEDA